jgi:hypothetical protein
MRFDEQVEYAFAQQLRCAAQNIHLGRQNSHQPTSRGPVTVRDIASRPDDSRRER